MIQRQISTSIRPDVGSSIRPQGIQLGVRPESRKDSKYDGVLSKVRHVGKHWGEVFVPQGRLGQVPLGREAPDAKSFRSPRPVWSLAWRSP